MAGNVGAMLVSLLAAPIIGRLFNPSDYGVAALFVTISMLFGSIAPLNYERAVLLPKDNKSMMLLMALSLRSVNTVALLVLLTEILLWLLDLPLFFGASLGTWAWILPAGIWLAGTRNVLFSLLTRIKDYRAISYTEFGQSILTTGSRVAAGLAWGSSISGLIGGFLLSYCAYLALLKGRLNNIISFLSERQSWSSLKGIAIEYRDFPLYSMPATFSTRFSSKLPILVIGAIFAPEITGFYAMADRLIQAPLMAAGGAIRRVYLQRTAAIVNRGASLRSPFIKTTIGLLLLGLIPFGFLGFFGAEFIQFLLGERWESAGKFVEILAPWYYAVWVGSVSQSTMTVLRRQALFFWLQFSVLIVRVAIFTILYFMETTPMELLTVFSIANVIMAVITFFIAYRLIWKMPNE